MQFIAEILVQKPTVLSLYALLLMFNFSILGPICHGPVTIMLKLQMIPTTYLECQNQVMTSLFHVDGLSF